MNANSLCVRSHPVEQHCFAYSTQSDHQDAFRGIAPLYPSYGDADLLPQVITTGECGRRRASSGGVRVSYRIHESSIAILAKLAYQDNFPNIFID